MPVVPGPVGKWNPDEAMTTQAAKVGKSYIILMAIAMTAAAIIGAALTLYCSNLGRVQSGKKKANTKPGTGVQSKAVKPPLVLPSYWNWSAVALKNEARKEGLDSGLLKNELIETLVDYRIKKRFGVSRVQESDSQNPNVLENEE